MMTFAFKTPVEIATELAARVRQLRLHNGWTQAELASRSGIALATYRQFERKGLISLERLLRIAAALGALNEFDSLFQLPPATTLKEIEVQRARKRGRRSDAKT